MSLTKTVQRKKDRYNALHLIIQFLHIALIVGILLSGATGVFLLLGQWPISATATAEVAMSIQVGLIVALLVLAFFGLSIFMLMQLLQKHSWGDKQLAELFAEFIETYTNPVWQASTDLLDSRHDLQYILKEARQRLIDNEELKKEAGLLLKALNPEELGRLLVQLRGVQFGLEDDMRQLLLQLDKSGEEAEKLAEVIPKGSALYEELKQHITDVKAFNAQHAPNVSVLRPAE